MRNNDTESSAIFIWNLTLIILIQTTFFQAKAQSSPPAKFEIFIAPNGNDLNDGSANLPILTLKRAQELVYKKFVTDKSEFTDVLISISYGKYYGQYNSWGLFLENKKISIEGVPNSKGELPTFVGVDSQFANDLFENFNASKVTSGAKMYLDFPIYNNLRVPHFIIEGSAGVRQVKAAYTASSDYIINPALNFSVRKLRIAHYCEGISAYQVVDKSFQGVTISDNIFENIGSKYDPNFDAATKKRIGLCVTALRLTHVQSSSFERNQFLSNYNIPQAETFGNRYGPAHFHSIYMAHKASYNLIRDNYVDGTNGPAFRFRNECEENRFIRNTFKHFDYSTYGSNYLATNSRYAAISEWFCFQEADACDDKAPECKTAKVTIEKNVYDDSFKLFHSRAGVGITSTCTRDDSAVTIQVTENDNYNSSQGICEIRAEKECPRMGLIAGQKYVDFGYANWVNETNKQEICRVRSSTYYNSCNEAKDPGYIQKISTTYKMDGLAIPKDDAGAVTIRDDVEISKGNYGKGCYVNGVNCSRMNLSSNERPDDKLDSQTNASTCLSRNVSWYNSCKADDPELLTWVQTRFFDGYTFQERTSGNGCAITANNCLRMGFSDGETKLDKSDNISHLSLANCQARTIPYWNSCTVGMSETEKAKVKVKVRYYKYGVEQGSKSYP